MSVQKSKAANFSADIQTKKLHLVRTWNIYIVLVHWLSVGPEENEQTLLSSNKKYFK